MKRLFYASSLLVAVLLVVTGCATDKEMKGPMPTEDFMIIAHRGASAYAPENTMASFALAKKMNADYIELDIQLTLDGEIVVLHDTDVMATTNSIGDVSTFTLKELQELTAKFRNEDGKREVNGSADFYGIPTLKEVFDHFGKDVHFIVELKDTAKYIDIEDKLVQLLEDSDRIGTDKEGNPITVIHSFETASLKKVRKLHKDIPIVQIISFIVGDESDQAQLSDVEVEEIKTYADALDINYEALTAPFVELMQEKGFPIYAYTVNDAITVAKMKEIGVNGIHTNNPDLKSME